MDFFLISVFWFVSLLICCWEDWYVVVDVGLLPRSDPDHFTALLLLQFKVGVKESKVHKVRAGKKLSDADSLV